MSPTSLLGPYKWLLYLGILLALALGAWRLETNIKNEGITIGKAQIQAQWDADKVKRDAADLAMQKAAQAQRDAQATAAQAAATAYEQSQARWVATMKVTKHALYVSTQNLASCRLSSESVGLLNDAANGKSPAN